MMNNLFTVAFFVLGVLKYGLCSLNVNCKPHYKWSDNIACDIYSYGHFNQQSEIDKSSCDIEEFQHFNGQRETYNFLVNYAKPSEILKLNLGLQSALLNLNFVPSEIFTIFPNLESVSINIRLKELDSNNFANAMNVTQLSFYGDQIQILRNNVFSPIAKMTHSSLNLKELSKLHENVTFPLHKLSELRMSWSEIEEIEDNSFYGLNRLRSLYIQRTQLTIIRTKTFAGLPSLEFLSIAENKIETIAEGSFDLPNLTILYIYNNKLKTLSDNTFDRLLRLEILDLSNNELEQIGRSLYGLRKVEYVSLENNRILDIDLTMFAEMKNLGRLRLVRSGFVFPATKTENDHKWKSSSNSPLGLLLVDGSNVTDLNEFYKFGIFPNLTTLYLDGKLFPRDWNLYCEAIEILKNALPLLKELRIIHTHFFFRPASAKPISVLQNLCSNSILVEPLTPIIQQYRQRYPDFMDFAVFFKSEN